MATTGTADTADANHSVELSLTSPLRVPSMMASATPAGVTTTWTKAVAATTAAITAVNTACSISPTSTKGCATRTGGKGNGTTTTATTLYGAVRNASTTAGATAATGVVGGGKTRAPMSSGTVVTGESSVRSGTKMTGTTRGMTPKENAFGNNTEVKTTTKIKPVNTMLHEKFGLDLG